MIEPELLFNLGRGLSALAFGLICMAVAVAAMTLAVVGSASLFKHAWHVLLNHPMKSPASASLSTKGTPVEEE